jgi:hypothetical protein
MTYYIFITYYSVAQLTYYVLLGHSFFAARNFFLKYVRSDLMSHQMT